MKSIKNFKKRELTNEQLDKTHGGFVNPALTGAMIATAAYNVGEAIYDWWLDN